MDIIIPTATPVSIAQVKGLPTENNAPPPESILAIFDDIWAKLLMLAKQLRDVMQFYNQKKQELSWGLEVNTLHSKREAIDESFTAAKSAAIGSIIGGIATVGLCAKGGEAGTILGQSIGQGVNGIANWASSGQNRQADQERAISDLQDKGAQSYAKTLDETLTKARDIMQQMMDLGRNLVDVLTQMLRAFAR